MLIFDQELARSADIKLKDVFVFHPSFVLVTPWYYIINQKIIQNSQVVKKKLNLKNQQSLFGS